MRLKLSAAQDHDRDVVSRGGGAAEFVHRVLNRVANRGARPGPNGLEAGRQPFVAEFFSIGVLGFGDSVTEEHQQIVGAKVNFTLLVRGVFEQAALDAFGRARFAPGLAAGTPVKSQITVEVRFVPVNRGARVSGRTY